MAVDEFLGTSSNTPASIARVRNPEDALPAARKW
jgi:hypothetical protein